MAKEFNIARAAGRCVACDRALEPKEPYMAVVVDGDQQLQRLDWCLSCWNADGREPIENPFGQWRGQMPEPTEKKKVFVDDDLLVNFFHRLASETEPARVNFRFVLTLILMRKRVLTYERTVAGADGAQTWVLKQRGRPGETFEVTDPVLSADEIAELSEQLSEILQGEL